MAATWPSAGGQSSFVRKAFGELSGSCIGVTLSLTLIAATGLIASFIVGYAHSLFSINEIFIKLFLFITVIILSLRGAKDLLIITLIVGFIAVLTLIIFSIGVSPNFKYESLELNNIPISFIGISGAIPFALWLFVGIEHTVTCSEETKNPGRNIPLGLTVAILILTLTGLGVLVFASGAVGTQNLFAVLDPLSIAISDENILLKKIVIIGVLIGLLASFYSAAFASSRQLFDVSRDGILPKYLVKIDKNGTPFYAVICVSIAGFVLSLLDPEKVMLGVVVMYTFTYILTSASYISLHKRLHHIERQYKAFGGIYMGYIMLISSILLFIATFSFNVLVIGPIIAVIIYILFKYMKTSTIKKTQ